MKNDKIFKYQEERLRLIAPLLNAEEEELRTLLKQIAKDNNISVTLATIVITALKDSFPNIRDPEPM